MNTRITRITLLSVLFVLSVVLTSAVFATDPVIFPEAKSIQVRDPSQLPPTMVPRTPSPRTVTDTQPGTEDWNMSLNEAIRIALVNAKVIRVLAGITAASSGSTIYDVAITNTTIDQEQARFDPVFQQNDSWNRSENPQAIVDFKNLSKARFGGTRIDNARNETRLDKTNVHGGTFGAGYTADKQTFNGPDPFILNPETRDALELSYTQPLLKGGGYQANVAPVVIARINTERSYFQYKDSVQALVRGVIEGYWNLVSARTDVWAVTIQVQVSEEAYKLAKARLDSGLGDAGAVAQAKVSYNQFRANLIQAEAAVLDREAALRNILFLPPNDHRRLIPTSEPTDRRIKIDWDALVQLAGQRRPDLIELKLVLEADQVRLAQVKNQALPQLDATALYRWNGLSGELLNGERISSSHGQFTDWTLGINFSVPLGLRQGRAAVREQELIVVRDRANLDQGVHAALHDLALPLRDLDSFFEQYQEFKETRAAALINLNQQLETFKKGVRQNFTYLNVLQALNDWGTAVSSEARTLLSYNITLAALEQGTGTILETHGLVFYEERFRAAGPLGIFDHGCSYPKALPPKGEPTQYPANPKQEPAENYFDLTSPVERPKNKPEELPPPRPIPK